MFWKQLVKLQQVSVLPEFGTVGSNEAPACQTKHLYRNLKKWSSSGPRFWREWTILDKWMPLGSKPYFETHSLTSKKLLRNVSSRNELLATEFSKYLNNKSCSFAPGTSPTSKARMCSNEGASMPGVKQEQVSPHVEGSCTNKLIRCLTKHWRRTSSNSRFPTAAENQLLTSCHGVYWDEKCKLGKHNAENNVCKPFYAVSSAMRLINDTRERCNQKTTYIKSCVWDHAHDVMRREAQQCFTVDILLHDSIWLQTIL